MGELQDALKKRLKRSDWYLIMANLVPVYGVWFLGWSAQEVFLVYCFESIIVGLFTFLKLGITGSIKKKDTWESKGGKIQMYFIGFMLFFLVHYGMFVAIQMGMFFSVSGIGSQENITFFNFFYKWPQLISHEVMIMLGVFITGYAFKNITDYLLSGEYRTASLSLIMFQPYVRIFVQQLTVILGSIFLSFGAGKIFILIFAFFKTLFEVIIDYDSLIKKQREAAIKT